MNKDITNTITYEDWKNDFNVRLVELRDSKHLTGKALARVLSSYCPEGYDDVDFTFSADAATYRKYERGDNKPNIPFLIILSKYYGVSLDYLITGKEMAVDEKLVLISEKLKKFDVEKQEKVISAISNLLDICE